MNLSPNNDRYWRYTIIVLLVVAILVIFIVSFGQYNPVEGKSNNESAADRKIRLVRRHEKLQQVFEKRTNLKKRLNSLFIKIYFAARIFLIGFWIIYNWAFVHFGAINSDLASILNLNEATLLIYIAGIYLLYGNISCISNLTIQCKKAIETFVYQSYLDLPDKITRNSIEIESIQRELKLLDSEAASIATQV